MQDFFLLFRLVDIFLCRILRIVICLVVRRRIDRVYRLSTAALFLELGIPATREEMHNQGRYNQMEYESHREQSVQVGCFAIPLVVH